MFDTVKQTLLSLFLSLTLTLSFTAHGEGSFQLGINGSSNSQQLVEYGYTIGSVLIPFDRVIYVDDVAAGEVINVHLCGSVDADDVRVDIYNEANTTLVTSLSKTSSTVSCTDSFQNPLSAASDLTSPPLFYVVPPGTPTQTYALRLYNDSHSATNGSADHRDRHFRRFDISVTPDIVTAPDPTDPAGRVWSQSWAFDNVTFANTFATDGDYYILTPGGVFGTNYVWRLDLEGLNGNVYEIVANSLGLEDPFAGYSADFDETPAPTLVPDFPIYLSFPQVAQSPPLVSPTISSFYFGDEDNEDNSISPGGVDGVQDSGDFHFTLSNVDEGTYAITIDLSDGNGGGPDGIYGPGDKLLLGAATAGANTVTWDGTQADNTVAPIGTYSAKLSVRLGEFHFAAGDMETSGGGNCTTSSTAGCNGLTVFQATSQLNNSISTPVYWDDSLLDNLQAGDVVSSLPGGYDSAAGNGLWRHTWGNFANSNDIGESSFVDTYVYGASSEAETSIIIADNDDPPYDFGDAPASYGDASHSRVGSGLGLGAEADTEAATLLGGDAGVDADGDDSDGSPDDEDGVTIPPLTQGVTSTITATVTGTGGYLQAWIDWNADDDFDDSGEQVALNLQDDGTGADVTAGDGVITLEVAPPATVSVAQTYARFRWSSSQDLASSDPANDGEVEDYALTVTSLDYGDAPADLSALDASMNPAYPTLIADNGAVHTLDGVTFLGSGVSPEADGQPTTAADGDDDDGVSFAGIDNIFTIGQANTVTVNASVAGFLNAWIDANQDGDFLDSGEQIATNLALSPGDNSLSYTPNLSQPHGATYMRFRFSSAAVTSPSPAGALPDGEVEDYRVDLALEEATSCQVGLVNAGFEAPLVSSTTGRLQGGSGYGIFREAVVPGWGSIPSNPSAGRNFAQRNSIEVWSTGFQGVTSYEGSQHAEINAFVFGTLYQDIGTTPGSVLTYQFAHRGRSGNDRIDVLLGPPGSIVSNTGGAGFTTGTAGWQVYTGSYTVPAGQTITRFAFRAISSAGGNPSVGNFLDDISFGISCDYGDAPTSYGEASHIVDLVTLGATIDSEGGTLLEGDGGAGADGDDNENLNDDDGVSTFAPININTKSYSVTVDVNNSLATNVTLYGWIDFDRSGTFESDEAAFLSGSLDGTQTLTWASVPNDIVPGQTYARFRLSDDVLSATSTAGTARGGEVEDYELTISPQYVSGTVFYDDGLGGGTAHDGLQNGGESGVAGVTVSATDGVSSVSGVTDAQGNYNLTLPDGFGADVSVSHVWQPATGSSIGGTTAAACLATSYGDAAAAEQYIGDTNCSNAVDGAETGFTPNTGYDDYDFGVVRESRFISDQSGQSSSPGVSDYEHFYRPGTQGVVTLSGVPTLFTYLVFVDEDCNGSFDPGEGPQGLPYSFTVDSTWPRLNDGSFAECALRVRAVVPDGEVAGTTDVQTVSAALQWENAAPVDNRFITDTTVITEGGQLELVKEVRNVTQASAFGTTGTGSPGEILEYRIGYTNRGSDAVTAVEFSDPVPFFTSLEPNQYGPAGEVELVCPDTSVINLDRGAVSTIDVDIMTECGVTEIAAGEGGTVTYRVRIQ